MLHHLFEENHYNPLERPVENESEPIVVRFAIVLQQIIDVDEKNQILHSNIWLQMTWIDANLVWDPKEFGGIEAIRVPATQIWKPDILMYNSADKAFDATYHTNIIVSHDGNCSWIPPGMFKSTCVIDIAWFPFDEQKCKLKFGSWTYDGRQLDLQLDEKLQGSGDTSNFIRNGEWELIDITFTLHIRRRTLYYGFNIIIPCVLISSMSLLLFLLPPDSGEKISLGVTILLSLMVFLLLVAETMPPTSDAVPNLFLLYNDHVFVVHTWVNGWLACLLQMKKPGRESKEQQRDYVHRARLRDSMLQERQARSLLGDVLDTEEEMRIVNGIFSGGAAVKREETTFTASPNTHELLAILKEVRRITTKCKREEEEIELKCEWRFAAMVIDRLCLWICLTFTVISTGVVMLSAPHLES
ncbi:hypothetical protein KUTeg_018050 [Tegillarca granosa]|uniref:Neuronal acetylcholine receptor subunit alpha-7 n=1 Tax=Tegillarca granosa TaxID=220873 RepID=A0ABQ9ELJ6_TEGGR|nr:hypothetical protein KUTeg_018050 [Tegillarca granosa]